MFDEGLAYKEGHMYQAWISFKDPAKAVDVEVEFPTTVVDEDTGAAEDAILPRTFAVPSWDNVICTLRYSEENPKRSSHDEEEEDAELPLGAIDFQQTCGFQLLSMYDTGDYTKVGKGQAEAKGSDDCKNWAGPNPSRSGFLDDGRVGVLCNFKRPFTADQQQQLEPGQPLDLIAGFNIYHSDTSDYRYAYGWSPDSRYRQSSWRLGATVTMVGLATAALAVLVTF